ncbi:MAG TPA: hypothetical protein VLI69_08975 [Gammaproteobacteria bacterium]|nr:hypothetical protein [Gammaproteobacteria bacterium]
MQRNDVEEKTSGQLVGQLQALDAHALAVLADNVEDFPKLPPLLIKEKGIFSSSFKPVSYYKDLLPGNVRALFDLLAEEIYPQIELAARQKKLEKIREKQPLTELKDVHVAIAADDIAANLQRMLDPLLRDERPEQLLMMLSKLESLGHVSDVFCSQFPKELSDISASIQGLKVAIAKIYQEKMSEEKDQALSYDDQVKRSAPSIHIAIQETVRILEKSKGTNADENKKIDYKIRNLQKLESVFEGVLQNDQKAIAEYGSTSALIDNIDTALEQACKKISEDSQKVIQGYRDALPKPPTVAVVIPEQKVEKDEQHRLAVPYLIEIAQSKALLDEYKKRMSVVNGMAAAKGKDNTQKAVAARANIVVADSMLADLNNQALTPLQRLQASDRTRAGLKHIDDDYATAPLEALIRISTPRWMDERRVARADERQQELKEIKDTVKEKERKAQETAVGELKTAVDKYIEHLKAQLKAAREKNPTLQARFQGHKIEEVYSEIASGSMDELLNNENQLPKEIRVTAKKYKAMVELRDTLTQENVKDAKRLTDFANVYIENQKILEKSRDRNGVVFLKAIGKALAKVGMRVVTSVYDLFGGNAYAWFGNKMRIEGRKMTVGMEKIASQSKVASTAIEKERNQLKRK